VSENRLVSETGIGEVLEQLETHFVALARKKLPRYLVRPGEQHLELDELVQQTRIKLWLALEKGYVVDPVAYARAIAYTESVNMQRRFKPICMLSEVPDDQLNNDRASDPSRDVEQADALKLCVAKVARAIRDLPPRQRHAMICSLKDARDDTFPLLEALQALGIDVEKMQWPDDKTDLHRLRASLVVSRKKLRSTCQSEDGV
jgi:DNA-directed RNA polymerase specialized sigma24 family protein